MSELDYYYGFHENIQHNYKGYTALPIVSSINAEHFLLNCFFFSLKIKPQSVIIEQMVNWILSLLFFFFFALFLLFSVYTRLKVIV